MPGVGRNLLGMRALVVILLSSLLGLGATPAEADIPSNVHDGRTGVMTADWGRVMCASSSDGLRCAIRVPAGFHRFDTTARSGDLYADMKAWSFPRQARRWAKVQRVKADEVVPGVRVSCEARGNQYDCAFRLDGRFKHAKVTVYSEGVSSGTMDAWF